LAASNHKSGLYLTGFSKLSFPIFDISCFNGKDDLHVFSWVHFAGSQRKGSALDAQ